MAQTVRQIAANEYGNGEYSVSAEQALWDSLPTMDVEEVARIVRMAGQGEQYGMIVAALRNATPDRVASLKALFSAAELQAMVAGGR